LFIPFVTGRHRNRHIISDGLQLGIFHGRATALVFASNMSGAVIPAVSRDGNEQWEFDGYGLGAPGGKNQRCGGHPGRPQILVARRGASHQPSRA
jgi:hypothetical protein